MSALAEKFLQTFFQQIPNCVCLVFAIGSLVALVFMLPKRRHNGRFYALLWSAFLFMGLWRCFKGIPAIRYASILIYPMVIATAFAGIRAEAWWRLLCRHFPRLPRWFGRVLALATLVGCAGGALLIAHYKLNVQSRDFAAVCRTISEYREMYPDLRVLVKQNDADRVTYYTKVPCIPLDDNQKGIFLRKLNGIVTPGGHFLLAAMGRHLDEFVPRKGELRPGAELSRIRAKRYLKSKRKDVYIYFYRNPQSFSRMTDVPPAPPASPRGLLGPVAFGPVRFAGALRSRPVQGGGGFRFSFVLRADRLAGRAPVVEIRTARRQGKREVRTLQMRCPVPGKGIYRGVAAFRVPPGPFFICLNGRGTAIRLEQFRLTREE